ncbi:MAG: ribonuclease III [Clostridia bacterium]|nr:ribonuclease III [Clostridia bacterium]
MIDFSPLERKINYRFSDRTLLETAFTHSSYAKKHGGKDNERMEYLGDAVLELIVSEKQYLSGEKAEGEMTQERQRLVNANALVSVAEELELKTFLRFEGSEKNVGKKTVSDLFETLVAALYLDGGMQAAKNVVLPYLERLKTRSVRNYKKDLQELAQKQGAPLPVYTSSKSGKDHAPVFETTVRALQKTACGVGESKKAAEQNAAKNLLAQLCAEN